MRILHISSTRITYPGGGEKIIFDMANENAKRHNVTVLQCNLYEENIPYKKNETINGVKVITCKNDKWVGGFGYSKEFKETLKAIWKYFDIVHIQGYGRFTSFFAFQFLKNKLPIIYTPHGFFHTKKAALAKNIHDFFFYKLIRKATFCTALTPIDKDRFLKIGVPENKIIIIPNFTNLKEFKVGKKIKTFLKQYGLNSKRKTILCLGRVHKSKGLHYVIEAVKDLDVNLMIVGRDAGFTNELKELVRKLNVGDRVKIIREVTNQGKLDCYANCDMFVLFSEWEGFGIVMIEAMAAELPVIVSDMGPLPDIVTHGENGLVARFPDVKDLKEKIFRLVDDEKLYNKIKKNEVSFVQQFDTVKVVKRIEELYEKAIKK